MNNSITIVGYVGQAPKSVVFGETGNRVTKFSVAVKEFSHKDQEDRTLWLDVEAWNGVGERALKTITKGREVVINGRLALSTYKKEEAGVKTQITKPIIILTGFHLCGKKPTQPAPETPETDSVAPTKELASAQA